MKDLYYHCGQLLQHIDRVQKHIWGQWSHVQTWHREEKLTVDQMVQLSQRLWPELPPLDFDTSALKYNIADGRWGFRLEAKAQKSWQRYLDRHADQNEGENKDDSDIESNDTSSTTAESDAD